MISHVYLAQLLEGQAEVFGTELALGEEIVLKGQKLAVPSCQQIRFQHALVSYIRLNSDPPACSCIPKHARSLHRSSHGLGVQWSWQLGLAHLKMSQTLCEQSLLLKPYS